jgi:hypothetical protein
MARVCVVALTKIMQSSQIPAVVDKELRASEQKMRSGGESAPVLLQTVAALEFLCEQARSETQQGDSVLLLHPNCRSRSDAPLAERIVRKP